MARILKEIIAASYKIGIRTDAVTKMIENTRESMVVDSHMTFASKPPDDVVIEWHLATLDADKDIDYFHYVYKKVKPYLVPSVKYITITATIKKPEDVVE